MIISCYLYPLIFILHMAFSELRIYLFISIFFSKANKLSIQYITFVLSCTVSCSAEKVFEVTLCYIIFVSPFPLVVSLKHII